MTTVREEPRVMPRKKRAQTDCSTRLAAALKKALLIEANAGNTHKSIANDSGIAQSTLSDYVNNRKTPTIDTLGALCVRLNLDANEILGICSSSEQQQKLTLNEYQRLAARTIRKDMGKVAMTNHALHGMVSEVGELHSLHQKVYQGHAMDEEHAKKEVGDALWFIAEYCTAHGWTLEEIGRMNIDKLIARYPDGFSEEHSLHRKEGDV